MIYQVSNSNYPITLSEIHTHCETSVSNGSISDLVFNDVISDVHYSLVPNEVLDEYEGNISDKPYSDCDNKC